VNSIKLAPSILAADFARLGEEVRAAESGGADRIHIDVMDGHFVPNLSMGPIVVQGLRPTTKLPLEVHLMVTDPAKFVEPFIKAGADTLIVHHEVLPDAMPLIRQVRGLGKKVGVAINPGTPVEAFIPYVLHIDVALCMTVWPGFGGQAFLPDSLERIQNLRRLIDTTNPLCELEVDGGINMQTAGPSADAGANVFVAGNALFAAPEGLQAATKRMAELVRR
jgi:ribulose-phosphate 3-epimerase